MLKINNLHNLNIMKPNRHSPIQPKVGTRENLKDTLKKFPEGSSYYMSIQHALLRNYGFFTLVDQNNEEKKYNLENPENKLLGGGGVCGRMSGTIANENIAKTNLPAKQLSVKKKIVPNMPNTPIPVELGIPKSPVLLENTPPIQKKKITPNIPNTPMPVDLGIPNPPVLIEDNVDKD